MARLKVSLKNANGSIQLVYAWQGQKNICRSNQKSTKTGKARDLPLVPSLQQVLADRHARLMPAPDDLVFFNTKGVADR